MQLNMFQMKSTKNFHHSGYMDIFEDHYVNHTPYFCISECSFAQVDGIMAEATINCGDKSAVVDANGNGRLDAVSNAIKQYFGISYELSVYEEHALSHGSSSKQLPM